MNEKTPNKGSSDDQVESKLKSLKVESALPVTAVGIESVKEGKPQTMSSHRRLYPWFAMRPTAATRLAILSSVLPEDISTDQLLNWMGIGPNVDIEDIESYVIKKRQTEGNRDGSVEDHYGYEYCHRHVPSESELDELQSIIKDHWDGDLPTVLDPTAGGGTIPLESARYGFPTISNELNPVAWLINKVILDYAPSVGELSEELDKWTSKVEKLATAQLKEYFPAKNGVEPNHYFRTYSTECPSCGGRLPLTNQWWFNRKRGKAVRPIYSSNNTEIDFECVDVPEDVPKSEFNPDVGTVDDGDASCPHCPVVTERAELTELFQNGEYEYEVCAIRYTNEIGGESYHAISEQEKEALSKAEEAIENNLDYATLLQQERYIGRQDRAKPYGLTQWRDFFAPRQLLTHATYVDVVNNLTPQIKEQHEEKTAEALLVLLSMSATRLLDRNTRLQPLNLDGGSPANLLGNNNFAFKWSFVETNPLAGTYSYSEEARKLKTHYQNVARQTAHVDETDVRIEQGDASEMSFSPESVDAVVMDPPYGSNVMYAEMSDVLYVWLREYLSDVFPDTFKVQETDKYNEAVENTAVVEERDGKSKEIVARERYENKMSSILSKSYDLLSRGGVITIYFTDRETETWDALTMSLINAGFVVTATHTITSEVPKRVAMQERASADSTLLLTCRKPLSDSDDDTLPTLWSDIRTKTREAARSKALDLLDSEMNLTKTDIIISAFGPTLRVFTESYPVVDKHDEMVRPNRALEEARTAVVEIILDRELDQSLKGVDNLTRWYVACWLVHERENVPYDDANQLGHGVGVDINDIKTSTKIWGKSQDTLILKGQSYRVRNYSALEAGEKRRKRAYPIDPRDMSFDHTIDVVHAALNVIDTKGSEFTWNWLNERNLHKNDNFKQTIKSLLQVLPKTHDDYKTMVNLVSGETGKLLDIDISLISESSESDNERTTLEDF